MVNRSLDQIGIIPCCLILIVPVPRRGAQLRIFPIRTAAKQAVACTRKLCTADRRAACGTPLPRLEDGLSSHAAVSAGNASQPVSEPASVSSTLHNSRQLTVADGRNQPPSPNGSSPKPAS